MDFKYGVTGPNTETKRLGRFAGIPCDCATWWPEFRKQGQRRPQGNVGASVRDLEETRQTRLLEREGKHLQRSDEGAFLYRRAAPFMPKLHALRDDVSGRNKVPRGRLKIGVPALFARDMLGSVRTEMVARDPEITVEVDVTDSVMDPVRDGYDHVVRVPLSPDSELAGRRFLTTDRVLAAPPDMEWPAQDPARVKAVVLTAQSGPGEWTAFSADATTCFIPDPVVIGSFMMVVLRAARQAVPGTMTVRVNETGKRGWKRATKMRLATGFVQGLFVAARHRYAGRTLCWLNASLGRCYHLRY